MSAMDPNPKHFLSPLNTMINAIKFDAYSNF